MKTEPNVAALAGIAAKIERAREHVLELNARADRWLADGPHAIVNTEERGDWIIAFVEVPPVPAVVPIIFGEVVHNLRSALDHLAWQLVTALGGKPGSHTYFPIAYEQTDFERMAFTRKDGRGRIHKGALHPLAPDHPAARAIRAEQPYRCWRDAGLPDATVELLAVLHRLWNLDKHRVILKATLTCPQTEDEVLALFRWSHDAKPAECRVNSTVLNNSLEGRHEIARFRLPTDRMTPSLSSDPRFPGEIMLYCEQDGRRGVRFGQMASTMLIDRVEDVVREVARFM